MTIIDLSNIRAIVEADGKVRCMHCINGGNYRKGCEPTDEIMLSQDDLEDPEKLYVCDYCEEEL
jgi:hypothetical protein